MSNEGGYKKRLKAEERKKQIAMRAAELFAKKGLDGVTTKEIASAARVNEALIFRFFPTKEALYTEIINQKIQIKPHVFDIKTASQKGDEEVFRSVAGFLLSEIKEDNTLLRLMLFSALEGHDLSSLFLKNRANVFFDFLAKYVDNRKKDGAFRDIKSIAAVRAFMGMFFHYVMVRELFKVPKAFQMTDEEALDHFVDVFLNGIRK